MGKTTTLFLIGLILASCWGCRQNDYSEYYTFSKQLTPSGKYIIYNYARYGSMAFSSDIAATEVFKVNESFEEGEGTSIDGSISEWISDDTLLVYTFSSDLDQPKDTLSIKTEYQPVGDFIVKSVFYKKNSSSRGTFDFDSVSTTNDSIIVRTVSKKNEKGILSFPLGGTTVHVNADSVTHIEVSTRLHKSMDFVLRNPDGTYTTDLPHIGITTFELNPVGRISPSLIQEKKVFWKQ